jgi:Ca2+-binding EF-hand superfamily protein
MKYLLNIAFFSTIILLALACTKEDETINFQESEALSSNNELRSMAEDDEKTFFISQPNPVILFKLLDKDNDGKISHEEAESAPKKRMVDNFDLLDDNKDGFIEEDEIAELSSKLKGERKKGNPVILFKLLDRDNDGKISHEEAENAPKKKLANNFYQLDKNSDGFIDKEEVINLLSMIHFH